VIRLETEWLCPRTLAVTKSVEAFRWEWLAKLVLFVRFSGLMPHPLLPFAHKIVKG
jgi:hypothetical protein